MRQRNRDEWRLSAKIANAARWSRATKEERQATGEHLREAKRMRWIMEIDPECKLSTQELEARLRHREHTEMLALTRRRLAKRKSS